jgi:hypothetical protein
MGEHGMGIKVERQTRTLGEKDAPKGFGGVTKGSAQFLSPLIDEETFLAVKEIPSILPSLFSPQRLSITPSFQYVMPSLIRIFYFPIYMS